MDTILRAFILIVVIVAVCVAVYLAGRFCTSIPRAFRSDGEGSEARFLLAMAPIALCGILVIAAGYRQETMQTIDHVLHGDNQTSIQEAPQHHVHKHHK